MARPAVTAARAAAYDCIIMDMHMPIMNGPDAMRTIRKSEGAAGGAERTPIIAVTAFASFPSRVAVRKCVDGWSR